MTTRTFQTNERNIATSGFTTLQKWVLLKAHPMRVVISLPAAAWGIYFLWHNQWRPALAVYVISTISGYLFVKDIRFESLSRTMLGKLALLHLHPFNLTVQLIGTITAIYGIWMHSTEWILGGASLISLGHLFGWPAVHDSLETES